MTRADLMARMGADELAEQIAYDRIEPIPDPYLVAGIIAANFARYWGGNARDRNPETYRPVRAKAGSTPRQDGRAIIARLAGIVERQDAQARREQ